MKIRKIQTENRKTKNKNVGANGCLSIENMVHGHNGNMMHRNNVGHNDGCNDVHNGGHNNGCDVGANGRSPLQNDLPELPKGWETAMLNELLISLESGSRPKGGVRGIKKGTPSIGGEHLKYDGTFDFSSIKYVSEEFANAMTKGHIQTGDILIVKDGATTGKTAFVDGSFPFKEAVVNEHVFICRPSRLIEPRLLFRYLMSKEGQEKILENFQGSAQGGINLSFAPNTEVPIAPLNEQPRIVAKLEKLLHRVDACKERLDKIPTILKRFRQSVLSAACSGRLTADWREKNRDVSAKCHSERSEESETLRSTQGDNDEDQLPATWVWKQLSAIANVKGGVTKGRRFNGKKTIFLPYLRVANVQDGYLDLIKIKQIEVLPEDKVKYAMKSGDLLFTEGGDRDKLGRGTVWRGEVQDCIHQNHIFRARLKTSEAIPDYVSITTKSDFSKHYFFENASQTVNLASINIKTLSALPLPLPPLPEQHEIVRRVDALFRKADEIEARYKKAKAFVDKLTQSILAKAFRGELVPQEPNDEPALFLLEKIRAEKLKHVPNKRENVKIRKFERKEV